MPAAKRLPAPATSWAAAFPVTWTGGLVVTVPFFDAEVVGAAVVLALVVKVPEAEAVPAGDFEVAALDAAAVELYTADPDEAADVAVPAEAHKALAAVRTARA
jgi:hypothetical protein